MPLLKIKKPCNDCPFRRKAASGWLGASYPEEFCEQTLSSQHSGTANAMPCHKTIDYEQDDWRTAQLHEAALCAGSLIFMNNFMLMAYTPDMQAAMAAVGDDQENVFSTPEEFMRHHTWGHEDRAWMILGPHVLVNDGDGQFIDHREIKEKLSNARR